MSPYDQILETGVQKKFVFWRSISSWSRSISLSSNAWSISLWYSVRGRYVGVGSSRSASPIGSSPESCSSSAWKRGGGVIGRGGCWALMRSICSWKLRIWSNRMSVSPARWRSIRKTWALWWSMAEAFLIAICWAVELRRGIEEGCASINSTADCVRVIGWSNCWL